MLARQSLAISTACCMVSTLFAQAPPSANRPPGQNGRLRRRSGSNRRLAQAPHLKLPVQRTTLAKTDPPGG